MIDLNDYAAPVSNCKCGKTHTAYTRTIELGDNAIEKLPEVCKSIIAQCRVGIVFDENTRPIAERAESLLVRVGYRTRSFCYPAGFESTREQSKKLTESSEDLRLWIAVGTGSIADTVRYAASCRGNEWVLVPTAPTTDAMLYPQCDYFENGVRTVAKAIPPIAVVADYTVLEHAPKFTVAAGWGTLMSKLMRAFDLYFDALTDKKHCSYLTEAFNDNLLEFFNTQSCESLAPRICRTLIRLGLIAQLADDGDFCQGGEYFAARCLAYQTGNKRLIGENAMICTLTAYCILDSYLKTSPEDLYVPASASEYFRYLDKQCGLSNVSLLRTAKSNTSKEANIYVLKEYAGDLDEKLHSLLGNLKGSAKQFRRLYDDAGYWLGSYCTVESALRTVCAAYAATADGLLSSLVLGGALSEITDFPSTF